MINSYLLPALRMGRLDCGTSVLWIAREYPNIRATGTEARVHSAMIYWMPLKLHSRILQRAKKAEDRFRSNAIF